MIFNKYISLNFVMLLLVLTILTRFFFLYFGIDFFNDFGSSYLKNHFIVEAFGKDEKINDKKKDLLDRDSFYMYDTAEFGKVELEVFNNLQKNNKENLQLLKYINLQKEVINETAAYVENKIAELEIIREEIQSLLKSYSDLKEDNIKSLVKIYENMKPQEAALIFSELDDTILLKVIKHMREVKSSPILAQMKPSRVREITIAMAERSRLREQDISYFCDLVKQQL